MLVRKHHNSWCLWFWVKSVRSAEFLMVVARHAVRFATPYAKAGCLLWPMACVVFTLGALKADASDLKRVLVLHSFGRDFSPFADVAASFRSELLKESSNPIDFYEASIYTARFEKPDNEEGLFEYLSDLFSDRQLDLVVTNGAPAAFFAQKYRQELFPETPILVMGADARRIPEDSLDGRDVMVPLKVDIPAYAENILRVLPGVTEVVVVIGDSALEQFWQSELRREFAPFEDRVTFTWLNDLPLENILQRVAELPAQSAIFYPMFAVDAAGVTHPEDRALAPIYDAASAPIFGFGDHQFGRGIVGGDLTPVLGHGRQAAAIADRLLAGEQANSIEIPLQAAIPVYDWRQLKKWRIDESLIPTGSIVEFRQPTAWEQYWWQMLVVLAVLLTQTLLIAGLLVERRRRQAAEAEGRDHLLQLARMGRRAVAGELSASIAHEINQPLAAIVSSGNAGLRWLSNKTPDLEEVAASLNRIVSDGHRASDVINSVRAMVKQNSEERRPQDINALITEVLAFLRNELDRRRVRVRTSLTENLPLVSIDRVQLQQVILNLILNAIDAMSSSSGDDHLLRVRTEANDAGEVFVLIEDNGTGIAPENLERIFVPFFTTKSKGMGMGLSICRSIIEAHGGTLTVAAAHKTGAVFQITLPIAQEEAV
jgi:signal transduction histidine kinase